jgi:hypothetical protein
MDGVSAPPTTPRRCTPSAPPDLGAATFVGARGDNAWVDKVDCRPPHATPPASTAGQYAVQARLSASALAAIRALAAAGTRSVDLGIMSAMAMPTLVNFRLR